MSEEGPVAAAGSFFLIGLFFWAGSDPLNEYMPVDARLIGGLLFVFAGIVVIRMLLEVQGR
jgi:hypothetical protein